MTALCRSSVAWILLAALVTGCGGGKYRFAHVAGQVTLDGNPIQDARVSFEPIGSKEVPEPGPGSMGVTDLSGRFHLAVPGLRGRIARRGAVVGPHRVYISTLYQESNNRGGFITTRAEEIPSQYNLDSKIEFSVPAEGTTSADFRLTSSSDKSTPKPSPRMQALIRQLEE